MISTFNNLSSRDYIHRAATPAVAYKPSAHTRAHIHKHTYTNAHALTHQVLEEKVLTEEELAWAPVQEVTRKPQRLFHF